jgi:hypothetical protein
MAATITPVRRLAAPSRPASRVSDTEG